MKAVTDNKLIVVLVMVTFKRVENVLGGEKEGHFLFANALNMDKFIHSWPGKILTSVPDSRHSKSISSTAKQMLLVLI